MRLNRMSLVISVALLSVMVVSCQSQGTSELEERTEAEEFRPLLHELLAAVKTKKFDNIQKCWASIHTLKPLNEDKLKTGELSKKQIDEMKQAFQVRDRMLADWFPRFIKKLEDENIQLDKLWCTKAFAKVVRSQSGEETTKLVYLVFGHSGKTFMILKVNGAIKMHIHDRWYLTGKPNYHFELNGKRKDFLPEKVRDDESGER